MTVVPARGAWHTLSTRKAATEAIEAWPEHLGAILYNGTAMIGICAYQQLGTVPEDWYDDQGDLLPMYRTESGDIRLPEVFNGRHVVGFHRGHFIGSLYPISDKAMAPLRSLSQEPLLTVLQSLGWDTAAAAMVFARLQELMTGLHTVSAAYIDSLLAAHGHFEKPGGYHSIFLDTETLINIRKGEIVSVDGQGRFDDDAGLQQDTWWFNERCKGSATIFIDNGYGQEPDALEAMQLWIDGEEQPKLPGYYD